MRFESLPGVGLRAAPAVRQYLAGSGPVLERFPYAPFDPAALSRRAEHLQRRRGADRVSLAQALQAYNRSIGLDAVGLENARLLGDDRTLAVVTGQQAGVCTGPLYTIYKAITAIRLARQLTAAWQVPVVPVFWVASEDHDYAEIARVEVPGAVGWLTTSLPDPPPGRFSVGHLPAGDAAVGFVEALAAVLPGSDFKAEVVAGLRADAECAGNLADWFARIMARLFAGTGLVFISPAQPAIRSLQAPFFARALQQHERVQKALAQGLAHWQELGFAPTVENRPGSTGLFVYLDGQRQPLVGAGSHFWLREQPEHGWDLSELVDLAGREPQRFSTGVTLRPVAQGWLFPDVVYVGGPGEIAYFGALAEVFQSLDLQMPVIFPRLGATLVEPHLERYLEKQNLTLAQVFSGLEDRKAAFLAESDTIGLDRLFQSLKGDVLGQYDQSVGALGGLGGNMGSASEEARKQIASQLGRLEEKAWQQHRKNCEAGLRQLTRLGDNLLAGGRLQERVANVTYFLIKYGPDLVQRLTAEVPFSPDSWQHWGVHL